MKAKFRALETKAKATSERLEQVEEEQRCAMSAAATKEEDHERTLKFLKVSCTVLWRKCFARLRQTVVRTMLL